MTEEDDFPGSGDIEITLEAEENEVLPHGYVFSGMQTDSGNGEFYEFTAGEDIEAAGWKYTAVLMNAGTWIIYVYAVDENFSRGTIKTMVSGKKHPTESCR